MALYGIDEKELERKENETEEEYNKRMYDLTCKFYDYIGW